VLKKFAAVAYAFSLSSVHLLRPNFRPMYMSAPVTHPQTEPLLAMPPPNGVAILGMNELLLLSCPAMAKRMLSAQLYPLRNFETALFAKSSLLVC